jgi:integrase
MGPEYEAALATLRRLLEGSEGSRRTVGEVLDVWLEHWDGRVRRGDGAPASRAHFGYVAGRIPATIRDLAVADLRPHHVETWLEANPAAPLTLRDRASVIRSALRWARGRELIPADPLAHWQPPRARALRRELPTEEEVLRLFAAMPPPLRQYAEFLRDTGCRPGEARDLEARHVDADRVVLRDHKTSHRTDRPRVIYLPDDWIVRLRDLAERYPAGPLFRNKRGRPWKRGTVALAFRRVREAAEVSSGCVAYALRHRYVTRLLRDGVPVAIVAPLVGHASPVMTLTVYNHVDRDEAALRAVVRRGA